MTVPVIDGIDLNTWAYRPQYGYGKGAGLFQGIFEWGLLYKENALAPDEADAREHPSAPFRSSLWFLLHVTGRESFQFQFWFLRRAAPFRWGGGGIECFGGIGILWFQGTIRFIVLYLVF